MAPRILICSASVGSGHGRAAQAIQTALTRLRPDAFVRHIDVLSLTHPIFRRIYSRGYFDMIDFAPHLVRYFYDKLDRPSKGGVFDSERLRGAIGRFNLRHFVKMLTEERWDLVISTHFLPPEIIASLRSAGRVSFPHAVVTTDFDIHRLWKHSPVERFFTATEEGRVNLAGCGVPLDRIVATGIPIDPVFSENKSAQECRRRHGIVGNRPVVLQLSGGQGFGPAEKVHRAILDAAVPLEIITVAGRNEILRDRLNAIPCPAHHRRTVLGYTDKMDELMAAVDVVVSKPGGLTTAEALARGVAMLVIEPIPGQEDRNCDFLLENGAAVKVNNFASLSHKLTALVSDDEKLQSLRNASAKLGRPQAAFDVARSALSLIERDLPPVIPPARPASRFARLRLSRLRRSRREPVGVK